MFSLGNTEEVHAEAEASETCGVGQILKLVRMTFGYLDLIPFHFYLSKPTRVDYKILAGKINFSPFPTPLRPRATNQQSFLIYEKQYLSQVL